MNQQRTMLKRGGGRFWKRPQRQAAQRPETPILKTPQEIRIMRESGRVVARVHQALRQAIAPGVSTWDLDQLAAETMQKLGARSCFLGYRGFPAHTCTSINEELVHGIPNKGRVLQAGDIISIDVGVFYRGFVGDSAWTYAVGEIAPETQGLMEVTEKSLYLGIEKAMTGNRVKDVSRAVQQFVEANGMHIVKEYTGHGVGRAMHEAPQVLNYVAGDADGDLILQPGLVFALEPMVQLGTPLTRTLKDEWTVISKDHSMTAHFEHTIAVTNNGPEILTLP